MYEELCNTVQSILNASPCISEIKYSQSKLNMKIFIPLIASSMKNVNLKLIKSHSIIERSELHSDSPSSTNLKGKHSIFNESDIRYLRKLKNKWK